MPKPAFRCANCYNAYDTETEARACEEGHLVEARRTHRDEILARHFPSRHKNDDKYRKQCVNCGILLIQWEREFEGHRAERGQKAYDVPHESFLGGLRCPECHEELLDKLAKMVGKGKS